MSHVCGLQHRRRADSKETARPDRSQRISSLSERRQDRQMPEREKRGKEAEPGRQSERDKKEIRRS